MNDGDERVDEERAQSFLSPIGQTARSSYHHQDRAGIAQSQPAQGIRDLLGLEDLDGKGG